MSYTITDNISKPLEMGPKIAELLPAWHVQVDILRGYLEVQARLTGSTDIWFRVGYDQHHWIITVPSEWGYQLREIYGGGNTPVKPEVLIEAAMYALNNPREPQL